MRWLTPLIIALFCLALHSEEVPQPLASSTPAITAPEELIGPPLPTPAEKLQMFIHEREKISNAWSDKWNEAKTDTERDTLRDNYPEPRKYLAGLYQMAQENPDSPVAMDALVALLQAWRGQKFDEGRMAKELLLTRYIASPDMINAIRAVEYDAEFLADVQRLSPHENIKAAAAVYRVEELIERFNKHPAKERLAELESVIADARLSLGSVKVFRSTVAEQMDKLDAVLHTCACCSPAPEIEGEDVDGVRFKLSDYRGKVVLLDFWGDWCGPCRAIYSTGPALLEKFKNEPFAIVAVNSDSREKLREAIAREKLPWRAFFDGGSTKGPIQKAWGITQWPTLVLIDAAGTIRYKRLGSDFEIRQKIRELLWEAGRR